jgi:hypothetical protein
MTFDKNSKLIRLYLWAWEGDPEFINFCKLFWGILFLPVAFFFHALFAISGPIVEWLLAKLPEPHYPTYIELQEGEAKRWARQKAKEEEGPNFFQRLLTDIGDFFDKISALFQRHEIIGVIIGYTALGLGAIGLGGGFIALWIFFPITMLVIFAFILGSILLAGLFSLIVFFFKATRKGETAWSKFTGGFSLIGQFFSTGYHAVKYRTCPAIVIEGATKAKKRVAA